MKGDKRWKMSSFNTWVREYSSEVKNIPLKELEINEYQSTYLQMFNILKETGWNRVGTRWVSPDSRLKFSKIGDAYISQKRSERIEEMHG